LKERSPLAIVRERRGLTQPEIAKELGIGITTYYYYETGQRPITVEIKNHICRILKIKPNQAGNIFLPSMFTVSKTSEAKK
jgi:transcriptional regulator with XRE-family HTH domain